MIPIDIKSINHKDHRYETVGDYYLENGVQKFVVSDMQNPDYEKLVILHEFIEQWLTEKRGISEESISAFDIEFEKNREEGNLEEPGDDKNAPYKKEHRFAENIERMVCHELGLDWNAYNETIENL